MNKSPYFDPKWRDDIYDEKALNLPLMVPRKTKPKPADAIWVTKVVRRGEEIFGKYRDFDKPRIITAIVKRNPPPPGIAFIDSNNEKVPITDAMCDLLSPPKAWMTTNVAELCTAYSVAKEATGDVLVGGLGLAIFPQMILLLQRPVTSITIIEKNLDIINIIEKTWLYCLEDNLKKKVTIIHNTFEDFAATTKDTYDLIYLDMWEDTDPRVLPYMNFLVNISTPLCKPTGKIRLWTYAVTADAFVMFVHQFEEHDIDVEKIPQPLDPLFTAYGKWRNAQNSKDLTRETCKEKARELAYSIALTDGNYDRNNYFTPLPYSHLETYAKPAMIMSAKRTKK